jgi:hypothetical protein
MKHSLSSSATQSAVQVDFLFPFLFDIFIIIVVFGTSSTSRHLVNNKSIERTNNNIVKKGKKYYIKPQLAPCHPCLPSEWELVNNVDEGGGVFLL